MQKFDIKNYMNIFNTPDRVCEPYNWVEHIPFAFFLVNILKPGMIVELGVHTGNSYNAFCQAVKELNLDTKCYGVDKWKGDLHSEFYDENIYKDISDYNDRNYKNFSSLMRMTFDDALQFFSDGTIDLLHIDGFHEYDSVRNDFNKWLPKMNNKGIILLHDINERNKVRNSNFGVWKLWEEISETYLCFNFNFGHGLGVILTGNKIDKEFIEFSNEVKKNQYYQNFFHKMGSNLLDKINNKNLEISNINQKKIIDSIKPNLKFQIFYSSDNNFNEKQVISKNISLNDNFIDFDLSEISDIKFLRIDPLNIKAVIEINEIVLTYKNNKKISVNNYKSNHYLRRNNILIFDNDDPQIYFELEENKDLLSINIFLKYFKIENEVYSYIIDDFKNKNNDLKKRLYKIAEKNKIYKTKITNLIKLFENKNNEFIISERKNLELKKTLNELYKTVSWKITQPLRFIKKNFHSFNKSKKKNNVKKKIIKKVYIRFKNIFSSVLFSIDNINNIKNNKDYSYIKLFREEEKLTIKGWIFPKNSKYKIKELYLNFDNKFYKASYGHKRYDVSFKYKNENTNFSGFNFELPVKNFKNKEYRVKFKIILGNNKVINFNTGLKIKFFRLFDLSKINSDPVYSIDSIDNKGNPAEKNSLIFFCNNGICSIKGWALDRDNNTSAGGVLIKIDDKFYNTNYGYDREDVSLSCNFNDRYLGFELDLPVSNIDLNIDKHEITVFIITKDNKRYYMKLLKAIIKVFGNKYKLWIIKNEPNLKELEAQKFVEFNINPKISIVTALHNTPKKYLIQLIDSVLNQTYSRFELCIAVGGILENESKKILDAYREKDSRIIVKFLNQNIGIAGNFNEAIKISSGDYILILDHDDTLTGFALFEIVKYLNDYPDADYIYSDEDKITGNGKKRFMPHFKPDYSPELLRCYNYMIHVSVIKKDFLDKIGFFKEGFEGSQDYDLILRIAENTNNIIHIPKILYHWRVHKDSTSSNLNSKKYAFESGKKALEDHLKRSGLKGEVLEGKLHGSYRIKYDLKKELSVSIIIPNKDHSEDLSRCIDSILKKSTYKNYEIIIIENNSTKKSTFNLYKSYGKNKKIRILEWNNKFNYSAINNYGAENSVGDLLLFLNNDTEVINHDWLERMIEFIQRDEVGAVGAKLYYENDTVQHGGVIVGLGGVAAHSHTNFSKNDPGYFGRATVIQNLSAVTAACLMIKKQLFFDVGMFDAQFVLAFNDIDLCMKVREKKYLIVWTPYAELYHYESKTRGLENTPAKIKRFQGEINLFREKWKDFLKKGDPYYNINLTLDHEDFSLKI